MAAGRICCVCLWASAVLNQAPLSTPGYGGSQPNGKRRIVLRRYRGQGIAAMRFRRTLLIMFLFVMAYALSSGPAAWLYSHKRISPPTYYTFLSPLSLAGRVGPPIRIATKWYIGFWRGQPTQRPPRLDR